MGCYNDDVLFIHIPKCGGWSCKRYLRDNLPGMLMPDNPASGMPIGHVRLQDIERFTGRKPSSFKKILAVVRDPYEQQLSQWSFFRDRYARGERHMYDVLAARYKTLSEFLEDPRCDFYIWYERHFGFEPGKTISEQETRRFDIPTKDGSNRYADFGGMFRFWLTLDGEIPDNVHILKQEELDASFPEAVSEFIDGPLPPMQRLNTSEHGNDTVRYYTQDSAKLVEDKSRWAFANYYEPWTWLIAPDRRQFASRLPKGSVGVEIGVWKGDFSAMLLDIVNPRELHLVDPWERNYDLTNYKSTVLKTQEELDAIYQGVCSKFANDPRVKVHRARSVDAAKESGMVYDWIYIDGIHTLEAVREDLRAWWPRLKPGGLMCGHDLWKDDVRQAAEEFVNATPLRSQPIEVDGNFVLQKP